MYKIIFSIMKIFTYKDKEIKVGMVTLPQQT